MDVCDSRSEGSGSTQGLNKELSTTTDPLAYASLAAQLPLPSSAKPTPLSQRQVQNLTFMAKDPDAYTAQVIAQLQHWTQRKRELSTVNQQFRCQLPDDKQSTVGKIDIFFVVMA